MTAAGPRPDEPIQAALDQFTAACLAGEAPEVEAFCREHTGCGPELRERLEEILFVANAKRELDSRREQGADRDSEHPESIGPYRILEVLGEGGMGTVYLAEQREPVRRRMALKVIKLGMDSKAVLQRFELERQALAVMNHENIARVLDCGTTERGQPYFALEYVQGIPLTEYCDRYTLSVEARLRLFQQLCEGVQHAHQKGVIHRDLKPGNVLVTEEQGVPVPKIIDFGLARATNHMLLQATFHTEQGRVIGTPEYMSPEQADPTAPDIDTRTDIYSLGVMLYELLVGALPFSREEVRQPGLLEMQRKIREDQPPRPSTKLSSVDEDTTQMAARRGMTPAALRRALRNDLDWVVLKAMDKDRNRRYESASGLAMDLGRYLTHDPLLAGPPSAGYRLRKLLRRYRAQVAAGVLVLVTAVVGAGVAIAYAAEAERQRETAEDNAIEATENAEKLRTKVEEFDMLALVVHLRSARQAEKELYPAWPEKVLALRAWLRTDVQRLREWLPKAKSTVQALRGRSSSESPEVAAAAELPEWRTDHESDRFLHDALSEVVQEIEEFERKEVVAVQHRLRWAEQLEEIGAERHRARWQAARLALARADGIVASELYREQPIELIPQTGLVPIGMNPQTMLWEFYHLRSAWDPESAVEPGAVRTPEHRDDGSIEVTRDTGIVFVLLPGRSWFMGAQSSDPSAPNHDALALPDESPVREVTTAPFFLARHEMTKGQWMRLSGGEEPSGFEIATVYDDAPAPIGYAHPVEMVDWTVSRDLLAQHGLLLPTEAQWEYGCRGGTTTPWWSGEEPASLAGCANLLDLTAKRLYPGWGRQVGEFDDRYARLAPVATFAPNPWGLFDVHGNVWEWCRDWFGGYALPITTEDGLRQLDSASDRASDRAVRGASYFIAATYARSTYRHRFAPGLRSNRLGLRASRALQK